MSGATSATSIGTLGLGAQGFGAGMSAGGAFFEASSKRIGLQSQATTAEANARIMELAAQSTILQGQREEQRSNLKYANLKGSQKAALAANGVDVSSVTAQNILTTTDTFKEIDANTIAANATRSAWGYRTQSTNFSNEALTKRSSAKGINPFVSGLTSLINSAGAIGKSMYTFDKETSIRDTSAVRTDLNKEMGPFDDSLPWRNTPWKAIY